MTFTPVTTRFVNVGHSVRRSRPTAVQLEQYPNLPFQGGCCTEGFEGFLLGMSTFNLSQRFVRNSTKPRNTLTSHELQGTELQGNSASQRARLASRM